MNKTYFIAKRLELAQNVFLEVLFDKNMNLEETYECLFRLTIHIAEGQYCRDQFSCRYVNDDKMISIDELTDLVLENLNKMIKLVESVDSGLNQVEYFTFEQPGLSSTSIDVRRDIKSTLKSITKYKVEPIIIDLYTSVLVKYKGTDTLQKRKLQKMIESHEDALNYSQTGRMF